MSKYDELKPCPFCGGEGCVQRHDFVGYTDTFGVVCLDCGCETRQFYDTEKDATEAWNRRANRQPGEWIDAEIPLESGGSMPIQVCSLCKTFYPLAYTGGGHRFCPNCGARMKGADDED